MSLKKLKQEFVDIIQKTTESARYFIVVNNKTDFKNTLRICLTSDIIQPYLMKYANSFVYFRKKPIKGLKSFDLKDSIILSYCKFHTTSQTRNIMHVSIENLISKINLFDRTKSHDKLELLEYLIPYDSELKKGLGIDDSIEFIKLIQIPNHNKR